MQLRIEEDDIYPAYTLTNDETGVLVDVPDSIAAHWIKTQEEFRKMQRAMEFYFFQAPEVKKVGKIMRHPNVKSNGQLSAVSDED